MTHRAGSWTAEYRFGRSAPVWIFPHSAVHFTTGEAWRAGRWKVMTPGVRLVRVGQVDALTSVSGAVPDKVTIRFQPYGEPLRADNSPALLFSNGDVALYTGQFEVAPLASAEALAQLPADLGESRIEPPQVRLLLRYPGGKILVGGKSVPERAETRADAETYAYFGRVPVVEGASFAGLFDPGLPSWIRSDLAGFLPRLLDFYRERLGPGPEARPMAFLSWKGPTPGRRGFGGSVLPGLILLDFEGAELAGQSPPMQDRIRWFFAHEASHFWLGQAVHSSGRAQAWLHEGGADALAIRALAELGGSDPLPLFQERLDQCVRLAPRGGLGTATARGDQLANYHCGAILSLAAESAIRKREPSADILDFWKGLIELARARGNRFDQALWLAELERRGGDPELSAMIARFAAEGAKDPNLYFRGLFERAGVRFTAAPDGRLMLNGGG